MPQQAQAEFHNATDARIDQPVVDALAVPAGRHHLQSCKALEVVRDRLGGRVHLGGDVGDRRLARACDRMQDPQPCVVRKDSEQRREFLDCRALEQWPLQYQRNSVTATRTSWSQIRR